MLYRTLGTTGWDVSVIGFGAWGIGGQWGNVEPAVAIDTVKAAFDAGITFFDTADIYGEPQGWSEHLVGQALRPARDKVILATKVGHWSNRFGHGLSFKHPSHVELCCDASLHRLKTEVIDLYQCHQGFAPHPEVFLEAFENLIARGKIRAGGISTGSIGVARAFHRGGGKSCATVQLDYSYLNRAAETELLPFCEAHGLGVIARGPLAKGIAAGKFTRETRFDDAVRSDWNDGRPREEFVRQLAVVDQLRFMERPGRDMAQAALQFAISHPAVSVAIPGAKSPHQARANAAAGAATLSVEELERIKSVAPVPPPPTPARGPIALAKRVAKKVLGRR